MTNLSYPRGWLQAHPSDIKHLGGGGGGEVVVDHEKTSSHMRTCRTSSISPFAVAMQQKKSNAGVYAVKPAPRPLAVFSAVPVA